jgi:hypothetical protein
MSFSWAFRALAMGFADCGIGKEGETVLRMSPENH